MKSTDEIICYKCGGKDIKKIKTEDCVYHLYTCQNCGFTFYLTFEDEMHVVKRVAVWEQKQIVFSNMEPMPPYQEGQPKFFEIISDKKVFDLYQHGNYIGIHTRDFRDCFAIDFAYAELDVPHSERRRTHKILRFLFKKISVYSIKMAPRNDWGYKRLSHIKYLKATESIVFCFLNGMEILIDNCEELELIIFDPEDYKKNNLIFLED